MEPLRAEHLRVRGKPGVISTKVVTFLSRHERVRQGGYGVDDFLLDFPASAGSIEIVTPTPYRLLAKIELEMLPGTDSVSLRWKCFDAEISPVFDDLLAELVAEFRDVVRAA